MRSWESRLTAGFLDASSKYWAKVPSHESPRSRSRYSSNRFTRSIWFTLSFLCTVRYAHWKTQLLPCRYLTAGKTHYTIGPVYDEEMKFSASCSIRYIQMFSWISPKGLDS